MRNNEAIGGQHTLVIEPDTSKDISIIVRIKLPGFESLCLNP